ncbi:autotransporter outer membrane beta-barrel domain-containing protein [Desulfoluna sp.]|uniref:autotransporter family protein n=1 Tax=Desulfoluna sp. TaxID=2045199 RepID=UPI0026328916|nr:autotransporter outer membrane beta-barrel domain-containing protein [Desulfoluna sp.]
MKKTCFDFKLLRLLAAFVCVAVVTPAWAADPAPRETLPIIGTDNTEAVNWPKIPGLIVQFEKDAALNVTGKDAAVSLGSGGSVMMAAGARLSRTGGEALSEKGDIYGIALSGGAGVTDDSRVAMDKDSVVALDGSDAVGGDGDRSVSVKGIGIDHAESAEVSMDGAKVEVTSKIVNDKPTNIYHSGIYLDDIHQATVTLQKGAHVTTDVSVADDGENDIYAWGVHSKGQWGDDSDQVSVACQSGSAIKATVEVSGGDSADTTNGAAGAQAVGVAVFNSSKATEVSVNDASITADATSFRVGQKVLAAGVQFANLGSNNDASIMRIEKGSSVDAIARGSKAFAVGGAMMTNVVGYPTGLVRDGEIVVASGSHITATAISKDKSQAEAVAAVLVTDGVKEVDVTITHAEITGSMKATAENTLRGDANAVIAGEGAFGIVPVGMGAKGYDRAKITLSDARVTMTADATARVKDGSGGEAQAHVGVCGMLVDPVAADVKTLVSEDSKALKELKVSHTAISLAHSTVNVSASATADHCAAVDATGIGLTNLSGEQEGDAPTLELVDSDVRVSAVATVTKESASPVAGSISQAIGIAMIGAHGVTTLNFDHAAVVVEATATTVRAFGIAVVGTDGTCQINLENGSQVEVISSYGQDDNSSSVALYLDQDATVNIDATSSVTGDCSVMREAPSDGEADVSVIVNNRGLISGRLDVDTLHNFATGTLQVPLDSTTEYLYDPKASNTFYFKTKAAKLDAGTTFRFMPSNSVYQTNKGQSIEYALLEATGPESGTSWDQSTLTLAGSPLLGLSWSGESTDQLIARIHFLKPAEAGLSGNATEAFNAALADMPSDFVFGTDPEAWAPKVSGAFLTGMAHTLVASQANIENRLGGLMGLNSGDKLVAAGGLWYNASFTDADQGKRDGIIGFDADTAGLSLGCDRQVGPLTLGVAFTQGKTNADADDGSSEMDMDDTLFSLYSSVDGGKWFGEAVLSAGFGEVDSARRLGDKVFTADYDSTSYNAMVTLGMKLNTAGWQITPRLVADYSIKDYDSYTETGGKESGALEVDSQDYTVLNVGGGATVQRSWVKSWGVLTPEASAMMRYDLQGDRVVTTARFVGGNASFVAHGADPAETSWELSTALTLASVEESAVSLRLGFDYAGREDFTAHSISGKVRFEF